MNRHRLPLPAPMAFALLGACIAACPLTAVAQSSYVMTTLSGSFSSDAPLRLDSQNRVLGTLTLRAGYRPNGYWWGLPEPYYENYMGQWAQPIFGSTVSSTQLSKQPGFLATSSPSGDKLVADKAGLYDRATKTFQALPSGIAYAADINNAGTVAGSRVDAGPPGSAPPDANNADAWRRALVWTPGKPLITLPTGTYTGAAAWSLNNAGVVVGSVYSPPSKLNARAARWVNGTLEVLENEPGRGSAAIDVSEGGHVLAVRWDTQIVRTPRPDFGDVYESIEQVNAVYGVFHQGVYTEIVANAPGFGSGPARARQINASGTVIGTYMPAVPPGTLRGTRAFIWQNGQMQDLTTLVATKGVKLPAGTVLNNVVSINDQGSLVAGFEHPSTGRQTYIRLQARP